LNVALEVCDLACVRGQRALFAGVSFSLAAGGALSVEGPNGVGKTSLLRMIAGFLGQPPEPSFCGRTARKSPTPKSAASSSAGSAITMRSSRN